MQDEDIVGCTSKMSFSTPRISSIFFLPVYMYDKPSRRYDKIFCHIQISRGLKDFINVIWVLVDALSENSNASKSYHVIVLFVSCVFQFA